MEVKKMETVEEEKETQRMSRPPNNLKSAIDTVTTILVFAFIGLVIFWIVTLVTSGFNWFYLFGAIAIFFLANCVNSIQIVQKPDIWIVERFGKPNRNLEAGVHFLIPWIETIRDKLKLYEQFVDGFQSIHEVAFIDGKAMLLRPKLWFTLTRDENGIRQAIYGVINYKVWTESVSGPIVRGYLNSLKLNEALDEGAARGDILAKMVARPNLTRKAIRKIQKFITETDKKIDELKEAGRKRDTGLLEVAKEDSEKELREKQASLSNQLDARNELDLFRSQASTHGIETINRFTVGEFKLSPEVDRAREEIQIQQKEREAALFKAVNEALMRTIPITKSTERFRELGFSEKDAREKAYMMDLIEKLSQDHSLFLTGGQENIQAIAAQIAAIFTKSTQRLQEVDRATKTGKTDTKT